MPTLIDFIERAVNGPIISEDEFNLHKLIPNVKKLVKEFNIIYRPEDVVSTDDDLADRLFEAAIEFLLRTGIYCDNTNRVINFQRREILEAVEDLPEGTWFGEGRDRRLFKFRRPDDGALPWFHTGTGIVSTSEDLTLAVVEGYAALSRSNSISIPAFNRLRELSVIGGSPLEIHATVRAVQAGRKALLNAGRPGLPILNLISSATTSVGTLAGSHPAFGLRPSDGWLIDFLAEMKVNFETLNRLAFIQLTGGNVGSTALPILGGYGGGAPGTALLMTAYYLAGIVLFKGAYHLTGPVHFRYGCSTTRDCLWVFSIVGRAASRNTRYPAIALGYTASGPATQMYFHEAAALMLACVSSGYPGIQTAHPAKAVIEDGVTPLDAQFCIEVAAAATHIQSSQTGIMVSRLLENYEKRLDAAPAGLRFQDCYDLPAGRPVDSYYRIYAEAKEELARYGMVFS
ncbi:MAG: monomethylamine:corrinoid methyltransferase [Anaerolineaceae bacterium]|nr:monomethylamine:corrinoid methyltransferase [Anaerolineaceae bacterium]